MFFFIAGDGRRRNGMQTDVMRSVIDEVTINR
jgi:hypothetical protein